MTDTTGDHVSSVRWFYVNTTTDARVQINASPAPSGLDTGDFTFVPPNDFDTSTDTFTGDVQDVARVLEINKNIVGPDTIASSLQSTGISRGGVVSLVCEITYRSSIFGDIVRESTVELQGQEQAGSAFLPTITSDRGAIFSSTQEQPIILQADLNLGGTLLSEQASTNSNTISFAFERPFSTGLGGAVQGTVALNATSAPSQTGTAAGNYYVNQLIVQRENVAGSDQYRGVITYDGETYNTSVYGIDDLLDTYTVTTPNNLAIQSGGTEVTGRYGLIVNGDVLTARPSQVAPYMEFQRFDDDGNGTVTQGAFENLVTSARLSGTTTGLTVTYHQLDGSAASTDANRQVLRVTYGAGATAATLQLRWQRGEIETGSDATTVIQAAFDDGL